MYGSSSTGGLVLLSCSLSFTQEIGGSHSGGGGEGEEKADNQDAEKEPADKRVQAEFSPIRILSTIVMATTAATIMTRTMTTTTGRRKCDRKTEAAMHKRSMQIAYERCRSQSSDGWKEGGQEIGAVLAIMK